MLRLVCVALLLCSELAFALNATELDCEMRQLALGYAKYLHSWRQAADPVFRQVHDALRLDEICHVNHHVRDKQESVLKQLSFKDPPCSKEHCIYVDANATDTGNGSIESPVSTLGDALRLSGLIGDPYNTAIVLRKGIHSLNSTITLGSDDSGLTLIGYPGEDAWLSGGIEIPQEIEWRWDCSHNLKLRVANLTDLLRGRSLPKVASLFNREGRLIRARYPNSDPEVTQWGYASPDKLKYSIPAEEVIKWHRPPKGRVPTFEYVDLRYHNPQKNDSTQDDYNVYASGRGGVCADLWGPGADSYWCSNASSGGWAEVDRECAVSGQLQIPVGMDYNRSSLVGQRLDHWGISALGAIVYAWHSQSWAMHMFSVESRSPGTFHFSKGSGRQGGRNWCRCDQCTYAGHWCGQHQDPPFKDDRLISGTWLVENVLAELDQPGEFFFDPASKLLYLHPNATKANTTGLEHLRFAMLERLIEIHGANDVHISSLGFRDSAATFMSDWSAPSGGDWALHRGGALFIQGSNNITVDNCIFRRLDGSAIFLSKRTRGVTIRRSIFEWLGENAIATWGQTRGFDATGEHQPFETLIEHNVMRELGIFQKQSSAVGHNKAAKTTIRNNIMFNMPRAAINFNDMMGGGDIVEHNLIFNTCRESGDHGPINTWDRQPFLTRLRNGTASFIPLKRKIAYNFIFANYGASQGVDNDDGSCYYHIKGNVFYTAEGFKMDYGGHDSTYEDNLVLSYPNKPGLKCIGFGSFFPGHGHVVRNNKCLVPQNNQAIISLSRCNKGYAILHDNQYFTPNGSVAVECGDQNSLLPLYRLQETFGLENRSIAQIAPNKVEEVVAWAVETLFHDGTLYSTTK